MMTRWKEQSKKVRPEKYQHIGSCRATPMLLYSLLAVSYNVMLQGAFANGDNQVESRGNNTTFTSYKLAAQRTE